MPQALCYMCSSSTVGLLCALHQCGRCVRLVLYARVQLCPKLRTEHVTADRCDVLQVWLSEELEQYDAHVRQVADVRACFLRVR